MRELYDHYSDPTEDCINIEGICKLFEDLELSTEDETLFILVHKMNASSWKSFTRLEFISGLEMLRLDTPKKIYNFIAQEKESSDKLKFKQVYNYAFYISSQDRKFLDVDTTIIILKMLLGDRNWVDEFCTYLQKSTVKKINFDQWKIFYEFSCNIDKQLSNYNPTDAWPTLIDDFVVSLQEQKDETKTQTEI
uniref:Defective in cullin neddylation protein n=1 Tax=Arcella intermedia TaxID=1963864 RepID=A0A6B2LJ40_9EUKA